MKLPDHLFVSSTDGCLYDTRKPNWAKNPPLRMDFKRTFSVIQTTSQLKATLRAGQYTWPGGYPMYFLTSDGSAFTFKTVRENLRQILEAIKTKDTNSGWHVCGCDVNWEDNELRDDHTHEPIQVAYA